MEFVKLPKEEFPELMQDEMQELLTLFSNVSGIESFNHNGYNLGISCHANSSNLFYLAKLLFDDGLVYKIKSMQDVVNLCKDIKYVEQESISDFMDSMTCPLAKLPKYIGRKYPKRYDFEGAAYTSAAVIAMWRMTIAE